MKHHSKGRRKSINFQKIKAQANITKPIVVLEGSVDIDLCEVVSKCNILGKSNEEWVDIGGVCHICANKIMFSS